jgi:hypothetical protein
MLYLLLLSLVTFSHTMNLPICILSKTIRNFAADEYNNIFYTKYNDNNLYIYNKQTTKTREIFCLPEITSLAVDETKLFLGYSDGTLNILDKVTGVHQAILQISTHSLEDIEYNKKIFIIRDSCHTLYEIPRDFTNNQRRFSKSFKERLFCKVNNNSFILFNNNDLILNFNDSYNKKNFFHTTIAYLNDCALTDTMLFTLYDDTKFMYYHLPDLKKGSSLTLNTGEKSFSTIKIAGTTLYVQ